MPNARRGCAKADLVTGMVGEFPELQGIMGGYYARAQGESDAVADAVRDHYKPVGQGDDVPTAPVTVAVSLADKLDTIANFFAVQETPTGSRDPFALRRAAIGSIAIIKANKLRLDLVTVVLECAGYGIMYRYLDPSRIAVSDAIDAVGKAFDARTGPPVLDAVLAAAKTIGVDKEANINGFTRLVETVAAVRDFFLDRLEVSEREVGIRPDIIRAAQIVDGDRGKESDVLRLLARVQALQGFVGTEEGANLLAGYKRAANILKSSPIGGGGPAQLVEGHGDVVPPPKAEEIPPVPLHPQPAAGATEVPVPGQEEAALLNCPRQRRAQGRGSDRGRALSKTPMAALASLRAPIDAFFDGVMVNDPDPAKRAFRLGLLARFRDAVHRVADFSRIEG
jgi:glycyl-tRNA synthetase beta chain